jgi:hypothetical protein
MSCPVTNVAAAAGTDPQGNPITSRPARATINVGNTSHHKPPHHKPPHHRPPHHKPPHHQAWPLVFGSL